MLKKLSFLMVALLLVGLQSCKTDTKTEVKNSVTVTGQIENAADKKLSLLTRSGEEPVQVTVGSDNSFIAEVPVSGTGYIDLRMGRTGGTLYAGPGDSVHIAGDMKEFDKTLTFGGSNQAENNFMVKKTQFKRDMIKDNKEFFSLPYEEFVAAVDEDKAKVDALYADSGLSAEFVALDKKMEDISNTMRKSNYKPYFEYFNKGKEAVVDDSYDKLMSQFDLNDEDLVHSSMFSSIISNNLENQEPKLDYQKDGAVAFQQKLYARALKLTNPAVKEKASYLMLNNLISYGGGMDNITTEVDDFKAFAKNAGYISGITSLVDKWLPLKKGNVAPTFSASDLKDMAWNSGDMKGKNMYVDVWATWCGPCKREIPYLKEVEKDYHGKNVEFVSISVDKIEDKDKWKAFVKDQELGGVQVQAPDAWESEVTKEYKITGIPRFLLIDAEGKIVSANAPRPSDESLKPMLDNLLTQG